MSRAEHPVHRAARALLRDRASADVRVLAAASELSVRQFQRAFLGQVGVSPKLFGSIARFASVLQRAFAAQMTAAERAAAVDGVEGRHEVVARHRRART